MEYSPETIINSIKCTGKAKGPYFEFSCTVDTASEEKAIDVILNGW
jgi:hypothetical protein